MFWFWFSVHACLFCEPYVILKIWGGGGRVRKLLIKKVSVVNFIKIGSNFLFIQCGKYWEQNNFCQCFSFFLWGWTYDHFEYFSHKKIEVNWKHSIFSKLVTQNKLQNFLLTITFIKMAYIYIDFICISLNFISICQDM